MDISQALTGATLIVQGGELAAKAMKQAGHEQGQIVRVNDSGYAQEPMTAGQILAGHSAELSGSPPQIQNPQMQNQINTPALNGGMRL